jgi:hypothetical protein
MSAGIETDYVKLPRLIQSCIDNQQVGVRFQKEQATGISARLIPQRELMLITDVALTRRGVQ